MHKRPRAPSLCIFCALKHQQWPPSPPIHRPQSKYFHVVPVLRRLRPQPNELDLERRLPVRFVRKEGLDKKAIYKLNLSGKDIRDGTKRLALGDKKNPLSKRELKWGVISVLDALPSELQTSSLIKSFGLSDEQFQKAFQKYREYVFDTIFESDESKSDRKDVSGNLITIYIQQGKQALMNQLRFGFYGQVVSSRFSSSDLKNQKALADLRYPWEWYATTRERKRKIHLHVGPTNSGKTYHALKRLEEADSGCYAGPLRLLAHEVYTRLNAKGKACSLITGDDFRLPPDWSEGAVPKMHSSTVEMMPFGAKLSVVVIDEIQMIADRDRGWAWAEGFLGINAAELHLCGEDRVVPLITELAKLLGDDLEIHRYERLNPLVMDKTSLKGNLSWLRKGDCVVSFTILGIHALRAQIEKATGRRCAVVYGSLPPETRAQQARLFNDPNNDYDYLVASDAVGMGLNLNIKRIIFETIRKSDGTQIRLLSVPQFKQIAGRAGRYRTSLQDTQAAEAARAQRRTSNEQLQESKSASPTDSQSSAARLETQTTAEATSTSDAPIAPPAESQTSLATPGTLTQNSIPRNVGLVTTLDKEDFRIVSNALKENAPPLTQAGIMPPDEVVIRFSSYFPPGTPFSYVLLRLHEIAQVSSRFFICALKDQLLLADAIHEIEDLTTQERLTFCKVPLSLRATDGERMRRFVLQCARAIAEQRRGGILELGALDLEILDERVRADRKFLGRAELLHKMLVGYLWLSFRFPGVFANRPLASHVKGMVEQVIEKSLSLFSFKSEDGRRIRQQARERELMEFLQRDLLEREEPALGGVESLVDKDRTGLEEAKAAADELDHDDELDEEEPDEVVEILRDEKTLAEEPEPQWDDEEEYPEEDEGGEEDEEDDDESDLITKDSSDSGAEGGSKSPREHSKRTSSDEPPFDSDVDTAERKVVHDAGPLYQNVYRAAKFDDKQPPHPSAPERKSTPAQPFTSRPSPEDLARIVAQEQQRDDQDIRP